MLDGEVLMPNEIISLWHRGLASFRAPIFDDEWQIEEQKAGNADEFHEDDVIGPGRHEI